MFSFGADESPEEGGSRSEARPSNPRPDLPCVAVPPSLHLPKKVTVVFHDLFFTRGATLATLMLRHDGALLN